MLCLLLPLAADGNAAKRQAAEEAAKARKNKERLHAMFAKAAGGGRSLRLLAAKYRPAAAHGITHTIAADVHVQQHAAGTSS